MSDQAEIRRALYFLTEAVRDVTRAVPCNEICRGVSPELTENTVRIDWELDWIPRKATVSIALEGYGTAVVKCVAKDACQWHPTDECTVVYSLDVIEWNQ